MGSISRRLTWERRIPICTKRFPLASGRVLTVPLRFRLKTFTLSPTRSALGSTAFLTLAGVFFAIFFSAAFIFSRRSGTLAFHIADGDAGGLAVFVEILDRFVCVFLGFPEDGVGFLVGLGLESALWRYEALVSSPAEP